MRCVGNQGAYKSGCGTLVAAKLQRKHQTFYTVTFNRIRPLNFSVSPRMILYSIVI